MHFEYYSRPRLQIHVIRILWMVPVYGVDAWLCLRFPSARQYLDPAREIYEAYVIYNFYMFLIHFLEDEVGDLEQYLATKPDVKHLWGLHRILRAWPMGPDFLNNTKLVGVQHSRGGYKRVSGLRVIGRWWAELPGQSPSYSTTHSSCQLRALESTKHYYEIV